MDSEDQPGHLASGKGSRGKHKGGNCSSVLGKGFPVPFRISPACSHFFLAMILFSRFGFLPSAFEFPFPESKLSWPELLIAD